MFDFDGVSLSCTRCGRHAKVRTPWLPVSGEGRKEILIIADNPIISDDRFGITLSGKGGDKLKHELTMLGYDLKKDFWVCYAVSCHCKNEPSKKQISLCLDHLTEIVNDLKPKAIFTLGKVPNISVLGHALKKTTAINSISGTMIPHADWNTWVFPLFDPTLLHTKSWDENFKANFRHELRRALYDCEDLPPVPHIDPYEHVKVIQDKEKVFTFLMEFLNEPQISAFDYECSGVKPYKKGHRIHCVAISTKTQSVAFMVDVDSKDKLDRKIAACFYSYLTDQYFKKICHNAQFEYIWSAKIFDCQPRGIIWCTMITQHLLDNRPKTTSLKHQTVVRWGFYGYDESMDKYLKTDLKKDPHGFNKIHLAPKAELLLYCGTDAYWTMQLYLAQLKEMPKRMRQARAFFHMCSLLFARMSLHGVAVDIAYYKRKDAELAIEITTMNEEIQESQEITKYINTYNEEFNVKSPQHLSRLFYDLLGYKVVKETAKGNRSVDEDALSKIKHWIAESIVKQRKLLKLKDTYIGQIIREEIDGRVHTDLTLNITRTFRSSSLSPNTQNWPKRDEAAMKLIRAGIIPSKDWILTEQDFSGAEVITAAAYNKDPNLITYLLDPDTDMHTDMACDLYKAKPEWITKSIRRNVKPATFGFFYGSYFKQVAPNMFECIQDVKFANGLSVMEHLKNEGIGTLAKFEKHVKGIEDKFWNDRFEIYKLWKLAVNENYRNDGEIWTFLGFRFIGYMDDKQGSNYPIQGTSFHLLMYALIILERWLLVNRYKTKIALEIHDSGIFDGPDDEKIAVTTKFQEITTGLKYKFKWLEVSMSSEASVSKVNGNFAYMKGL